jgi:hypothetical protein
MGMRRGIGTDAGRLKEGASNCHAEWGMRIEV